MRTVALGDIVDFYSGGTPSKSNAGFWQGDVPWFSAKDLKKDRLFDSTDHISESVFGATPLRRLPAGTIAVVVRGMILAHTVPISILEVPAAINQDLKALLPKADVDTSYLAAMLRAQHATILSKVGTAAHGTKKLDSRVLESIEIPLPPLSEQRRVAAILDHADALRAKRRQVLAHLAALRHSIFLEMFGREGLTAVTPQLKKSHPAGWEWVPLTEVSRLATGHTPDRANPEYWDGDISWISLPEIRRLDGRICYETELKVSELGIARSSAVVLPEGTVCFSRTASVGFVTTLGAPMATSQDFHNWVPGPDLHAGYLMDALRVSRAHLLGTSDGSIHKTIYQRVAERFRVLLPPLELQRVFAARRDAVDRQRVHAQRALESDDDLFASLHAHAFRGEL